MKKKKMIILFCYLLDWLYITDREGFVIFFIIQIGPQKTDEFVKFSKELLLFH